MIRATGLEVKPEVDSNLRADAESGLAGKAEIPLKMISPSRLR
jgi:hypothetical protein